jgi:hypothetical protein
MRLTTATSALVVNFFRLDEQSGDDCRRYQADSGDKNGAIAKVVTYGEDKQRSGNVSGGVEGLVAAELTIENARADQPHGDRRHRWREERRGTANQHLCAIDGELAGLPCEQRGPEPEDERTSDHDQPLAAHPIDNAAGRRLKPYGDKAAYCECIECGRRAPV